MAVDTSMTELLDVTPARPAHPLDPLSGAEIERAASVVLTSDHSSPTLRFVMISLAEGAAASMQADPPAAADAMRMEEGIQRSTASSAPHYSSGATSGRDLHHSGRSGHSQPLPS